MLRGDHVRAEESFEIAHNKALHYTAFRLGNRGLLGERDEAAADDLRRRFRAIWIGASPPGDDDLLDAIFEHIPLQKQEHRELVGRGLVLAGLTSHRY